MSKKIIYFMIIVTSGILFIIGYCVGYNKVGIKKLPLGGELYNLNDRYKIQMWFYESGELSDINILDINKNILLINNTYYESGIIKSSLNRTHKYNIYTIYNQNGNVIRKSYKEEGDSIWNGRIYRIEHYSIDGKVTKIEEPNYTIIEQ